MPYLQYLDGQARSLTDLPEELLVEIVGFASTGTHGKDTLKKISGVSKHFRRLTIGPLFRSIRLRTGGRVAKQERLRSFLESDGGRVLFKLVRSVTKSPIPCSYEGRVANA